MDYGIDVSMFNAIADANLVRGNGITYAWCKATEGIGWIDPTFANKVSQLRAAGIVVGGYHFARSGDPREQARAFRTVASASGCLDAGALMPMVDMESADVRDGANDFVTAFFDELTVSPMDAYANLDWWANVLRPDTWGTRVILGHVARYNGDPGQPGWGYAQLAVHQHTDKGLVPGIAGNVDRDATVDPYGLQSITIGNVAPVPAPTPPMIPIQPTSDAQKWTVRSGDTLSGIASAWGVTVASVAVANAIADIDLIYVGQVIHRPGSGGSVPTPSAGDSYTVAAGDTLSAIASTHSTTVAVLVALNHISNPDRIVVGQILTLPGAQRVYIVQSGDTLSGIADTLGFPGGYSALAARNHIDDPDTIYPGQKIYY